MPLIDARNNFIECKDLPTSSPFGDILIAMKYLLSNLILWTSLSAAAMLTLVDPQNDPDVLPHVQRGYFELPENSPLPKSSMTLEQSQKLKEDFLTFANQHFPTSERKLLIDIQWNNPYYSANARYQADGLVIAVWGGFLRAPGLTPAILVYTFCHELGHLVGGEPKQTNERNENVTVEGASDFFAARRCTDLFLKEFPSYQPTIFPEVKKVCQEQKNCELSLQAGLETFRYLQKWGFTPYEPVTLSVRSPEAKEFIPNTYPTNQCRMETVLQAALCLKNSQREDCEPPPCWWPRGLKFP